MRSDHNIALVHDDLIQHGGAEKIFFAMREIWPEAPVFTSITNKQTADYPLRRKLSSEASRLPTISLKTSFMQKLPFATKIYRGLLPLYPLAFESFDLSEFDVVISSSSRFAHGVITRPETLHVWYCYSPARYLYFQKHSRLTKPVIKLLKSWDQTAANRPDKVIAISHHVADNFEKVYGRRPDGVVYPFVDWSMFQNKGQKPQDLPIMHDDGGFFLIVSRLVDWKKIDLAVLACNRLRLPLVIVGTGPAKSYLKSISGETIFFAGYLTDQELVWYYQHCRALIMTQEEDFGIVALEAQASGKPVVSFLAGGARETVIEGKTGCFFYPQTSQALAEALQKFNAKNFNSVECRDNALKFDKGNFVNNFQATVINLWHNHQRII